VARARGTQARARKVVNYTWSQFQSNLLNVAGGTKVLLGFFFLATAFEETVVRVRGMMTVITDQTVAGEPQVGAFGMIRVTDRAIAIGATAIPGPMTDGDDDGWFVWTPFAQIQQSAVTGSNNSVEIDSKAQRIVREGQQLAVMFETAPVPNSEGVRVTVNLRALSRFRS